MAIDSRNEDMAEQLLEKSGVDRDPENSAKPASEILTDAASTGSLKSVHLLLTKYKADPNPWEIINRHSCGRQRSATWMWCGCCLPTKPFRHGRKIYGEKDWPFLIIAIYDI